MNALESAGFKSMHVYDEASDFFVEHTFQIRCHYQFTLSSLTMFLSIYENRATAISTRRGPTLFALRTTNQELTGTRLLLSLTLRCISDFTEQNRGGLTSSTLIRRQ